MPHPLIVEINSRSDGMIKGSGRMYDKTDAIVAYAMTHDIHLTPVMETDGDPLDRLTHEPLTILKETDSASPVLSRHLTSCDLLSSVVLRFYKTDPRGKDVNFYSVTLSNAIVTKMAPETKPVFLSKNEPMRHMEHVSFAYKSIRWTDELNSKEAEYSAYLLHDYRDEKKLLTQGSLSTPIAPVDRHSYGRGTGIGGRSPIKTGVFDRKTHQRIPLTPTPPEGRFKSTRGVAPASLADAKRRLARVRKDIKDHGYRPKYSDAQLTDLATNGNVGEERFQARFMEETHLNHKDTPTVPLSGAMGLIMEGATGKGAKYWSTSFDQIEDADTDPRLLCGKLGLTYDPEKKYVLILVDTEKSIPLTGVKSVPATFEKVSEFANTELPLDFPKSFTDIAMTPDFQAKYSEHYAAAVYSGDLPYYGAKDVDQFRKYLSSTNLTKSDKKFFSTRMKMHEIIGNNQDYVGNGLTKDMIRKSPNQFGAVETLNFERKEINLKSLNDAGAITIIQGLNTI
jgi:type VI secretion system Hcp family effector